MKVQIFLQESEDSNCFSGYKETVKTFDKTALLNIKRGDYIKFNRNRYIVILLEYDIDFDYLYITAKNVNLK